MRETALALFAWYGAPASERASVLGPDFEARSSFAAEDAADWSDELRPCTGDGPPRLLGVVADAEHAALFFESVDPVTMLTHRVAWWLDGVPGRIDRLLECGGFVGQGAQREGRAARAPAAARPAQARGWGSLGLAVEALVAWWKRPVGDPPAVFTDDAEVVGLREGASLGEWLGERRDRGSAVTVHRMLLCSTEVAVFLSEAAPVPEGERLTAWWIEGASGRIRRVVETWRPRFPPVDMSTTALELLTARVQGRGTRVLGSAFVYGAASGPELEFPPWLSREETGRHDEHAVMLGVVAERERAAVFFTTLEPETRQVRVVGLYLEGRSGRVDRLIECNGHVGPRSARSEAAAAVVVPPSRTSGPRTGSLEQAVAALVAWWAAPTPEVPAVFHEDAELMGQGGPEETLSGWLGARVGEAGAVVRVHGTVASETAAAVFFDDITPGATSKRLVAWWIEGDSGGIRRILDTSTLGSLPDSPPASVGPHQP